MNLPYISYDPDGGLHMPNVEKLEISSSGITRLDTKQIIELEALKEQNIKLTEFIIKDREFFMTTVGVLIGITEAGDVSDKVKPILADLQRKAIEHIKTNNWVNL